MQSFEKMINNQSNLLVKFYDSKLKKYPLWLKPLIVLAPFLFGGLIIITVKFDDLYVENISLFVAIFFSLLWMYLGQILIYKHFDKVYKCFWIRLYELCDKNVVIETNRMIIRRYKFFDKIILVAWILLIEMTAILGINKLEFLFTGYSDFMFFLFLVLAILPGYLTSIGLSQSFKMLYSMKKIFNSSAVEIPFDELNQDGVGNYSIIASYSFKTTKYLTSGVLFIPICIEFIEKSSNRSNYVVLFLIICFSLFTLASMIYPLYKGYIMANKSKNDKIFDVKHEINKVLQICVNEPTINNKILLETLDYRLKTIEDIPTYPFQLNVILKIIGTTLIPIITFFAQLFLTQEKISEFIKSLF